MYTHLRCYAHRNSASFPDGPGSRISSIILKLNEKPTIFKLSFCTAANELARSLHVPLEDIGDLFGSIMSTGTVSKLAKQKFSWISLRHKDIDSAERGESPVLFGSGQVLFIVRRVNRAETSRLQGIGFRFSEIKYVVDTLAESLEVSCDELYPLLDSMRASSQGEHVLKPGVHLAYFTLRPVLGLDLNILVRKDATNLLPTALLQDEELDEGALHALGRLDGLTVSTCLDLLQQQSILSTSGEEDFRIKLLKVLRHLTLEINDVSFGEAKLVARPLAVPCRPPDGQNPHHGAYLIALRHTLDAHQHNNISSAFQFISLKFFLCQQHANKGSPDNDQFGNQIEQEFADFKKHSNDSYVRESIKGDSTDTSAISPKKMWSPHRQFFGSNRGETSSEKGLVISGQAPARGGIQVLHKTDVDISEADRGKTGSEIELATLGSSSEAGMDFVEELLAMEMDDRKIRFQVGSHGMEHFSNSPL